MKKNSKSSPLKKTVGAAILWNVPLGILFFSYLFAWNKLNALQIVGAFTYVLKDEKELAIKLTLWFYYNQWVFIVSAAAGNCIFLFFPRKKYYFVICWSIWVLMLATSLWFSHYFLPLFR